MVISTSGDHIPKIEYTAEEIELWLVDMDMILSILGTYVNI